jgi:hypothetical protein
MLPGDAKEDSQDEAFGLPKTDNGFLGDTSDAQGIRRCEIRLSFLPVKSIPKTSAEKIKALKKYANENIGPGSLVFEFDTIKIERQGQKAVAGTVGYEVLLEGVDPVLDGMTGPIAHYNLVVFSTKAIVDVEYTCGAKIFNQPANKNPLETMIKTLEIR